MWALHAASYAGDVSGIRLALQAGEEVDLKDAQGFTPLIVACGHGNVAAARALLEAGAAVD